MSKTVIITGAAGNLGKAAVEKFLDDGYTVIATVSPGSSPPFVLSSRIEVYPVNLMDETAVENFILQVSAKHARIDAAVLLAGGFSMGSISNTTGHMLQDMYRLNFETAYFVARPVFNLMVKQHHGRIIFTGARPALQPADGKDVLAYALSKSMLFKLAEFINAEGAAQEVTATVIVPSIIDTPANRAAMPTADFSSWVKAEDIACQILHVVSNQSQALRDLVLKIYNRA